MHADIQLHQRAASASGLTPGQAFAAVTGIIVALLGVFASTTASMVGTWTRSETFTHGFLVIPAALWFVWMRRDDLARIPVQPSPWALVPLTAAGLLWLLGDLSSSLAPSQLAMIAMVPCVVAALFGWRWVRTLLFPLVGRKTGMVVDVPREDADKFLTGLEAKGLVEVNQQKSFRTQGLDGAESLRQRVDERRNAVKRNDGAGMRIEGNDQADGFMLAGVGAGLFQSGRDASQMAKITGKFEPRMAASDRQARHALWNAAVSKGPW